MTLLTGPKLVAPNFVKPSPTARASSLDLTIGRILDHQGKEVGPEFLLKPGHTVLVVSQEVFDLPDTITGHVTYKTTMTKRGIWALTVGIVDPGWDGPIATTLLNFSSVNYVVSQGDPFLRVSLFEHPATAGAVATKSGGEDFYLRELKRLATSFPETFLDKRRIVEESASKAAQKITAAVFIASALLAIVLALAPFAFEWLKSNLSDAIPISAEVLALRSKTDSLEARVARLEARKREEVPKR